MGVGDAHRQPAGHLSDAHRNPGLREAAVDSVLAEERKLSGDPHGLLATSPGQMVKTHFHGAQPETLVPIPLAVRLDC